MNYTHAQTALNVLQFVPSTGSNAALIECFDAKEWESVFTWLDSSGLGLYFWSKIQKLGWQDALPPAVRSRFDACYRLNSIRTEAMIREWRNLQRLLNSAPVRSVVLKGLAKVPEYCADAALRVQFDHDWMIERGSLGRADELLCSLGYQRKQMREADRAVYLRIDPSHDYSWNATDSYSPKVPRPVELHLDLWDSQNERIHFLLPTNLLAQCVTRVWSGETFWCLSDEDGLLFEVLHAFRHIIHNWCRLSVLYEIAHFLDRRACDVCFWSKFCARIENNLPLRRVTGVVLTLSASSFGVSKALAKIPDGFFGHSPELPLWVKRYGMKSALGNFSKDKHSLFLLREFVDGKGSWRMVKRRRLFPMPKMHRFRTPVGNSASAPTLAKCQSRMIFVRRLGFHLRGALLYAWQWPYWRLLIRHEKNSVPDARRIESGFSSSPVVMPGEVSQVSIQQR